MVQQTTGDVDAAKVSPTWPTFRHRGLVVGPGFARTMDNSLSYHSYGAKPHGGMCWAAPWWDVLSSPMVGRVGQPHGLGEGHGLPSLLHPNAICKVCALRSLANPEDAAALMRSVPLGAATDFVWPSPDLGMVLFPPHLSLHISIPTTPDPSVPTRRIVGQPPSPHSCLELLIF